MSTYRFYPARKSTNRSMRNSLYRLLRSKLGIDHKLAKHIRNEMLASDMPTGFYGNGNEVFVIPRNTIQTKG